MLKHIFGEFRRLNRRPEVDYKTHKEINDYQLLSHNTTPLPVSGQGVIEFKLQAPDMFHLDLIATNAMIRLVVSQHTAKFYCVYKGRFILLSETPSPLPTLEQVADTTFWISFHAVARSIQYGKIISHERLNLLDYTLPPSNKTQQQFWMNSISKYRIDTTVTELFVYDHT